MVYLVGNKADLVDSLNIKVSKSEIDQFIFENRVTDYAQTSAKLGTNIEFVFNEITTKLLRVHTSSDKESGKFEIQVINNKTKKKC